MGNRKNAFFDSNATTYTEDDLNELFQMSDSGNAEPKRKNAFFDSNATSYTEDDLNELFSMSDNASLEANKGQTKTAPKSKVEAKDTNKIVSTSTLSGSRSNRVIRNANDVASNSPKSNFTNSNVKGQEEKPFTVVYNGKTYKEGETIDINGKKVKVEKPADYGQTSISNSKETTKLSNADNKKKQQMENTSREGRWAAEHPVVATALDFASTPITSLGSGVETIEGLVTGDTGNKFARNQANLKEGIRSNIGSDAGKFVFDMGIGLGEMMTNLAASQALGAGKVGFGILSGAKAAGEQTMNAMDRGVDTRKASLYGTGAGVLEGVMNTKGLNIIEDKLGTSTVKSLGDVARNMGAGFLAEGGENLLQESLQTGLDNIINGDNSEYDIAVQNNIANGMDEESAKKNALEQTIGNILKSGLTGGLFGSVFAGGKMGTKALGDIPQLKAVSDVLSNAKGKLSDFFSVESLENKNLADSANDVADALRNIDANSKIETSNVPNSIEEPAKIQATEYVVPNNYRVVNGNTFIGKGTKIDNQYTGNSELPMQTKQNLERYEISNDAMSNAKSNFEKAKNEADNGGKFSTTAKKIYEALFDKYEDKFFNSRVNNLSINGQPYDISVHKGVVSKALGGKVNEVKMAVLEDLDNIIKDSNYVGSGDYVSKGKNQRIDRYDYFERPISVNGKEYTVTFSVAVEPKENRYRTHAIIDEIKIQQLNAANTGTQNAPLPAAATVGLTDNITQKAFGVNGKTTDINAIKQQIANGDLETARNNLIEIADNYEKYNPMLVDEVEGLLEDVENQIEVEDAKPMTSKEEPEVWENEDTGLANTTEEFTDGDVISSTEEPLETVASTEEELVPYRPSEGGKAESRGMTNTARMNDIYRGLVKQETDALSEHEIKTNQETFERAFKSILNPEDALKEEQNFRNGTTRMDNSAEDMARGVLLLQDLASQYDEAIENGDTAKATELNIRRTLLMRKYSPATTNVGQTLQSLKMFSHSIEGAELASEKILNDRTKAWKENNVKESKTVDKLSSKLLYAFNKLVEPEKANIELTRNNFDEHYKEVMNTINEESSSFANNFTEEDAKYIANLLNNGVTKEELADMIATKMATGTFGLKPETQAKVNELFKKNDNLNVNSKEFVENEAEAYRLIANEICANSTIGDKFNAWRYLAMLGNPKTMIRNVFGNKVFGGITSVSNGLSAAVESGVDKTSRALGGNGIDRTKAVLTVKDKGLIDAATKDADNNRYRQLQGDKYHDNVRTDIEKNKDVWNSKLMRGIEELVGKGLSDYKSARKKYGTSLAGYLKANGLDASVFDAEVRYNELDKACKKFEYENRLFTPEENAMLRERSELNADVKKLQKARDYAQKQAEYAVFHEDNKVADAITKFSNATRLTHIITEGIMPFKKTPANILRSGVEYSPLGAVDSIAKTGKLILDRNKADTYIGKDFRGRPIEKQKVKASDVIDSWSKTLTGTGLTVLGAYLYDRGILLSSNDDEKYQDQLEGIQNYALKFSADGQDYTATVDFLAPTVMPLLVGAEMVKAYNKNADPDESFWDNITKLGVNDGANIATSILSPIMETSMLSGVSDTLDEIGRARQNNEDANPLGTALWNTSTGYVSQAVPTLAGQIARTFDNTRRSTYSDKEGVERTIDRQLTKMKNKIPGLSDKNEAYVDARGNTQKNGLDTGNKALDLLGNAAYQFASPSYIDKVETTDADKLARDVFNATNDEGVFADLKTKKKVNGEPLNKEDYTQYAKIKGESNNTLREMLVKDERLANMTDVEKKDVLKAINSLSDLIGESNVNEDFATTSARYSAFMEGGYEGALDNMINEAHTSYLGSQLKEKGISNNETTRELLESGDNANLTKYANAEKIAKEYGRKSITETQWNAYKNRGESTFRNELMLELKAKEYGVSDTKAFREAYANGDARGYAEAYKAITSLEYGTDEYGNSKKLDYTNTTREIYDSEGVQGLKNYIEVSKKLDEVGMDKKDIQILVQHNNLEYAKTHTESQLRVLKRVEDSGNAQKNWIPALKKEKLSTEDAYDVIEVMTGGKFPKETNGMNHKQIVSYYYNKKLKD